MNIKNLFQKAKPKQLNASTRRASIAAAEDYDNDEPNVRLSRAFLVVMLLHVVAVGGIFAFSSLKKNAPATIEPAVEDLNSKTADIPSDSRTYKVASGDSLGSIASTFGLTRNDLETANNLGESSKIQPGDKLIIPAKSSAQPVPLNVQKLLQLSQSPKAETVKSVKPALPVPVSNKMVKTAEAVKSVPTSDSAETIYVVQKGDNPVVIAKKHGIKYADLIEANKITDPKKLQIGQKLIIPKK